MIDLVPTTPPPPAPVPSSPAGPTTLAVRLAAELVDDVLAELPALAVLAGRDRLLAAAWLASLRLARTRRSYAGDLLGWQAWLAGRGVEVLGAGRFRWICGSAPSSTPGPAMRVCGAAVGDRLVLPLLPVPRPGGR